MTDRPEDRNSREVWRPFTPVATLAELEEFIADARRRGAPDDAVPRFATNAAGEAAAVVCLVERHPESTQ